MPLVAWPSWSKIKEFLHRYLIAQDTAFWSIGFWRRWFSRPENDITLVLLTKQHLEMRKIKFSRTSLFWAKIAGSVVGLLVVLSAILGTFYVLQMPTVQMIEAENRALRKELSKLEFHLDVLQGSVDRMARFDQKLRALTDVDKRVSRARSVMGQGGGDDVESPTQLDFGDYRVDTTTMVPSDGAADLLDRRAFFRIQKVYAWMSGLFQDSLLQEQSLEELFEVLKGREIQLAATPSILPVSGWITSHFGYRMDPFTDRRTFHKGMDIVAREGTPVMSPAEGVVTFSGYNGTFGKTVMLFHGYGVSTLYAHLDDTRVRQGQRISRGDVIGTVGNTGRSTATHLHYEVVVHGVNVDPRRYVLDRAL
jgi:murein DD-endopeptidase MepM/ murein hydrolase activator NlpD